MAKLIVFELRQGNLATGFRLTVDIFTDNHHTHRLLKHVTGNLASASQILDSFTNWKSQYWHLKYINNRGDFLDANGTKFSDYSIGDSESDAQKCADFARLLQLRMRDWYASQEFDHVREILSEALEKKESIRLIVKFTDSNLLQIPWNLLFASFLEMYPNAEIALSVSDYRQAKLQTFLRLSWYLFLGQFLVIHPQTGLNFNSVQDFQPNEQISAKSNKRLLAILGDKKGIEIEVEKQILQTYSHSIHAELLVEPSKQELEYQLRNYNWDILFISGHSSNHGQFGNLYINKHEKITIVELKILLSEAISKGLKLAIFNSVDGIELIQEIAILNIPQVVVMREPLPDKVAYLFLKELVKSLNQTYSVYLAVRKARERMRGLESKLPGVVWLPVICQSSYSYFQYELKPLLLNNNSSKYQDKTSRNPIDVESNFNSSEQTSSQINDSFSSEINFNGLLNIYIDFCDLAILLYRLKYIGVTGLLFVLLIGFIYLLKILLSFYNKKIVAKSVREYMFLFTNFFNDNITVSRSTSMNDIKAQVNSAKKIQTKLIIVFNSHRKLYEQFSDFQALMLKANEYEKKTRNRWEELLRSQKNLEEIEHSRHDKRLQLWDVLSKKKG